MPPGRCTWSEYGEGKGKGNAIVLPRKDGWLAVDFRRLWSYHFFEFGSRDQYAMRSGRVYA